MYMEESKDERVTEKGRDKSKIEKSPSITIFADVDGFNDRIGICRLDSGRDWGFSLDVVGLVSRLASLPLDELLYTPYSDIAVLGPTPLDMSIGYGDGFDYKTDSKHGVETRGCEGRDSRCISSHSLSSSERSFSPFSFLRLGCRIAGVRWTWLERVGGAVDGGTGVKAGTAQVKRETKKFGDIVMGRIAGKKGGIKRDCKRIVQKRWRGGRGITLWSGLEREEGDEGGRRFLQANLYIQKGTTSTSPLQ